MVARWRVSGRNMTRRVSETVWRSLEPVVVEMFYVVVSLAVSFDWARGTSERGDSPWA